MNRIQLRSFIIAELKRFGIAGDFSVDELNDRINLAKNELCEDVGGFPGYCYGTTTPGVSRYEYPQELITLRRVEFDGKMLNRVYTDAVESFDIPETGSITWTVETKTGV